MLESSAPTCGLDRPCNSNADKKRKIFFHGYLKELVPEGIELTGRTVAEILNGLTKQVKSLRPTPRGTKHIIQAVGFNSVESLMTPLTDDVTELHFVPAMQGGKSGVFKIVLGAIIITAAVLATGGTFAALAASPWGLSAAMLGATLAFGGLLEIVSPTPKADLGDSVDNSKYLASQGNTVKIGTRIPIGYGRHRFHGHFLSFNVNAVTSNPNSISDHSSWDAYRQLA